MRGNEMAACAGANGAIASAKLHTSGKRSSGAFDKQRATTSPSSRGTLGVRLDK